MVVLKRESRGATPRALLAGGTDSDKGVVVRKEEECVDLAYCCKCALAVAMV